MEVPRVTAQSVSGEQVGAVLSHSGGEPAWYPEQSGRMFFTEHPGIARGFARLIVQRAGNSTWKGTKLKSVIKDKWHLKE